MLELLQRKWVIALSTVIFLIGLLFYFRAQTPQYIVRQSGEAETLAWISLATSIVGLLTALVGLISKLVGRKE
ncbi:MAG: hypothetical protein AAGB10_01505 [Pseudomonadota bacterium]